MDNVSDTETDSLVDYLYAYSPRRLKTLSFADTIPKLREKIAPYRFKLAARAISRELGFNGGEKILELGSGLGLLGKAVKEEVGGEVKYFGIDLAYNSGKTSLEKGLFSSQASAGKLPFPDNSFDAVVTTDVLEHIPDDRQAVRELHRVLKPGGKAFVVIADPSEPRFGQVTDHINRSGGETDIEYWENLFKKEGLPVLPEQSERYRAKDWRKLFNLPFLVKLKEKPGFACAFNPVNRPGTYIMQK